MGDGRVQRRSGHRPVVGGIAVVGHRAIGPGHPVPVGIRGGGHPDGGGRHSAVGLAGHRRHRIRIRRLAPGGGHRPARPVGLARAVDRVAGRRPGHDRARRHRIPLGDVLGGLAGVGRRYVRPGLTEQLDRPRPAGAAGHAHTHVRVGGGQHVLAVAGGGHVLGVHPVGAVTRPVTEPAVPGVGGEHAHLVGGRGRSARTGARGKARIGHHSDGRQVRGPRLGVGLQTRVHLELGNRHCGIAAGRPLGVEAEHQVAGVERLHAGHVEGRLGSGSRPRGHRALDDGQASRQQDRCHRDQADATEPRRAAVMAKGGPLDGRSSCESQRVLPELASNRLSSTVQRLPDSAHHLYPERMQMVHPGDR